MKKCPFCAEDLQDEATICRFCNRQVVRQTQPENPVGKRLVALLTLGLGGALLVILVGFYRFAPEEFWNTFGPVIGLSDAPGLTPGDRGSHKPAFDVTMAEYLRLQEGITYEEAVAILGRAGVEQSRSELAGITTVMYSWTNRDGIANMNAMFQNGRLISKAQLGLR